MATVYYKVYIHGVEPRVEATRNKEAHGGPPSEIMALLDRPVWEQDGEPGIQLTGGYVQTDNWTRLRDTATEMGYPLQLEGEDIIERDPSTQPVDSSSGREGGFNE